MTTYIDHFKARICYGYKRDQQGRVYVDETQAKVVQLIFDRYLNRDTLRGIAQYLTDHGFPTPSGKPKWNQNKVDAILMDIKYIPYIISNAKFQEALAERQRRSNTELTEDMSKRRKATRYSKNVLSGLFVCPECGASYRRIARNCGEVVWRCASRVEQGKGICKHSPTLREADLLSQLCTITNTEQPDLEYVSQNLERININYDGSLIPTYKQEQQSHMRI